MRSSGGFGRSARKQMHSHGRYQRHPGTCRAPFCAWEGRRPGTDAMAITITRSVQCTLSGSTCGAPCKAHIHYAHRLFLRNATSSIPTGPTTCNCSRQEVVYQRIPRSVDSSERRTQWSGLVRKIKMNSTCFRASSVTWTQQGLFQNDMLCPLLDFRVASPCAKGTHKLWWGPSNKLTGRSRPNFSEVRTRGICPVS